MDYHVYEFIYQLTMGGTTNNIGLVSAPNENEGKSMLENHVMDAYLANLKTAESVSFAVISTRDTTEELGVKAKKEARILYPPKGRWE